MSLPPLVLAMVVRVEQPFGLLRTVTGGLDSYSEFAKACRGLLRVV